MQAYLNAYLNKHTSRAKERKLEAMSHSSARLRLWWSEDGDLVGGKYEATKKGVKERQGGKETENSLSSS